MKAGRAVPCNGCVLCCRMDMVRLLPDDDPSFYFTEPHPLLPGHLMLAHDRSTGNCIYLNSTGCSIHAFRPRMCREMDCRSIARAVDNGKVMVRDETDYRGVIARGRELLSLSWGEYVRQNLR